jgi:hypothetical protein
MAHRHVARHAAMCLACLLVALLLLAPAPMLAGGTCMLRPEAFMLRSDTVRWSIRIRSGAECIQGLRWSTLIIEGISVTEQPKLGKLVLGGPSFRYISDPGAHGTDSFKLKIDGTSLRIKGTSSIEVEVSVD